MQTTEKQLYDVNKQVANFINDSKLRINSRSWISNDLMQVYVRVAYRYINNIGYRTFEIASVQVYNPGKGTFTAFLKEVLLLCFEDNYIQVIYIENVLNERFASFFDKLGFEKRLDLAEVPSFYKMLKRC